MIHMISRLQQWLKKEIKYEQSLRITNWDRPSDTITATSPEIHVNKERRLSAKRMCYVANLSNGL